MNHNLIKRKYLLPAFFVLFVSAAPGCANKTEPAFETVVSETPEIPETAASHNSEFYQAEASLTTVIAAKNSHFGVSAGNDNADRRLAQGEYEDIPVTVGKEAYDAFTAFLDRVEVVYEYEPYYAIPAAHEEEAKYETIRAEQSGHYTDLICDTSEIPSGELLTEVIEANSAAYLRDHTQYQELDRQDRETIIRIIREMVESNYGLFSEEDKRRIYSLLSDISIVGINSLDYTVNDLRKPYNARVLEDGTIIIDPESIRTHLKDPVAREKTYEHEIYHLFQRMCPSAQAEGYYQIGPCQYFDDLAVNSLHWNWLYEAAAEKKVMNHYQTLEPLVYKNMIGYLRSLDLVTLLRPEYKETAVEDSTLTVDREKMFELLGAKTDTQKNEIICLLYSIDYVQNDREDFEKAFGSGEYLSAEERSSVKKRLKEPICLSISKIFYRNLAERILNSSVSLQDIYYLINVLEQDINYHSYYYERADMYGHLLQEYVRIQDAFFEMLAGGKDESLADGGSPSREEIADGLHTYAMAIRTPEGLRRNCSLNWLTPGEREFLYEEMVTFNISYMTENMRDVS